MTLLLRKQTAHVGLNWFAFQRLHKETMKSKGTNLHGNNVAMYSLFSRLLTVAQWYFVFCTYKFGCGRFFFITWFAHEHHCHCHKMSVNDKIKVLWKTSCEWRDKPHFPKRKDFQLREGESESVLLPLNPGDAAKIKFGSRWYNVEVAESWTPKSRKGMYR